jgi:hypothetical protein
MQRYAIKGGGGFGNLRKEVRVEIEKQYSERDLFYLTERTEVKK